MTTLAALRDSWSLDRLQAAMADLDEWLVLADYGANVSDLFSASPDAHTLYMAYQAENDRSYPDRLRGGLQGG